MSRFSSSGCRRFQFTGIVSLCHCVIVSLCSIKPSIRGDPDKQVETGRVGLEDPAKGKHSLGWRLAQVKTGETKCGGHGVDLMQGT